MPSRDDWQRRKATLERERDGIFEEIRRYPTPIPACDLQFNHLLGERARVARALAQLETRLRGEWRTHERSGEEHTS